MSFGSFGMSSLSWDVDNEFGSRVLSSSVGCWSPWDSFRLFDKDSSELCKWFSTPLFEEDGTERKYKIFREFSSYLNNKLIKKLLSCVRLLTCIGSLYWSTSIVI